MGIIESNEKYLYYSAFSTYEKTIYCNQIYYFLWRLNIEYFGFSKWYRNLFLENNNLKKDREIILCEKNHCLAGIIILKSTEQEKKICTVRVSKEFQKQGIGKKLIKLGLEWLETDKPLITMHKSKQRQFEPLLNYFDFTLEQEKWNYYNIFSAELCFNGVLPEKKILFNKFEIKDISNWYENFILAGKCNLDEFIDECIVKWYRREQIRRNEMLRY
ncbi:hypothetical protein Lac2_27430 [Claveliimonas bilis]|uniref:GNAT family N-acetyltransferase n=1 Tax=Claveliimonas bilis TaxID=3028070 RepID=UPI002931247E|nr:GNAT family N-acetyltransferase [Claveliimonas bilis]BDZ84609.1 hypothetical protein Lac2_27430 [Claveliimonas bilis]